MRALIVVDVQNDFCEGGSMAVPGGSAVAAAITEAVGANRGDGRWDFVITTQDWHIDPGDHWASDGQDPDWATTWPPHCAAESVGAALHDNLRIGIDERFHKGQYAASYSGFDGVAVSSGTTLTDWLHEQGVTATDVVGLATDYCVKATALDAASNGFTTTVLLKLCAAIADDSRDQALVDLETAAVQLV